MFTIENKQSDCKEAPASRNQLALVSILISLAAVAFAALSWTVPNPLEVLRETLSPDLEIRINKLEIIRWCPEQKYDVSNPDGESGSLCYVSALVQLNIRNEDGVTRYVDKLFAKITFPEVEDLKVEIPEKTLTLEGVSLHNKNLRGDQLIGTGAFELRRKQGIYNQVVHFFPDDSDENRMVIRSALTARRFAGLTSKSRNTEGITFMVYGVVSGFMGKKFADCTQETMFETKERWVINCERKLGLMHRLKTYIYQKLR